MFKINTRFHLRLNLPQLPFQEEVKRLIWEEVAQKFLQDKKRPYFTQNHDSIYFSEFIICISWPKKKRQNWNFDAKKNTWCTTLFLSLFLSKLPAFFCSYCKTLNKVRMDRSDKKNIDYYGAQTATSFTQRQKNEKSSTKHTVSVSQKNMFLNVILLLFEKTNMALEWFF